MKLLIKASALMLLTTSTSLTAGERDCRQILTEATSDAVAAMVVADVHQSFYPAHRVAVQIEEDLYQVLVCS